MPYRPSRPLKSRHVAGLDIGTSAVRVVIAEVRAVESRIGQVPSGARSSREDIGQFGGGKELRLLGLADVPSRGLRKGVVINIEATVAAIAEALEQAEKMAGVKVSSVYCSISGNHLRGFSSNGIVGIRGKEVSLYDIEKVMEAAKAVAIPMDREVLHILPQEFSIDDQDGIREPVGMSGVRLEARVHMITGAIASAQNVVKCANRCGLTVRDIIASPLAAGAAVVSSEERDLGVCLVDIGGGTTDIAVYQNGAVCHTSVLSVGGGHITNDIAAGLRTPIAAAEKIKCEYGSTVVDPRSDSQTLEVPSTGGRPARILSRLVLSEIIEPRVREILELVRDELRAAEAEELLSSGIVLTGGTANLHGVETVAEEVFQLPVRVGRTAALAGMQEMVSHPEYSTAVGLVVHGSRASGRGALSPGSGKVRGFFRRVSHWFVENF
ncbi:cell division protein FtsA [bacterium]|nr:cell division protein FtsA [bacterium]